MCNETEWESLMMSVFFLGVTKYIFSVQQK